MKRILISAFTLLMLVTGILGQNAKVTPRPPEESQIATTSWKRYTVLGEKFSVKLPTHPAMNTDTVYVAYRHERREIVLGAYAEGVVYSIYTLENRYPEKSLSNYCKDVSSRPVWDRATEQKVTLNNFEGREYHSSHPLGGRIQMFSGNKRLYRFQAFGAHPEDARVKEFFSSIVLQEKEDAIPVNEGAGITYQPSGQAESSDDQQVLTGRQVDRKAMLIMKPEPRYTLEARQFETTGTVVLKTVFAADGSVTNIRVVSELPHGLTARAIETARKIKFIPAMKNGKYVSMWMQLEYNFNLY